MRGETSAGRSPNAFAAISDSCAPEVVPEPAAVGLVSGESGATGLVGLLAVLDRTRSPPAASISVQTGVRPF
jgi:hypothetical protein